MAGSAILVVDDEQSIRLAVARCLESMGLLVQTAVNGEEALQKLRQQEFAVVFLDLRMPGMDGLDALRRIMETRPRSRVVVITAYGTVESAVEAMKLGAADFIQKPFTPEELRAAATRALARNGAEGISADDYQDLIDMIRERMAAGQLAEARELARRAIAGDPTRPEGYNLLGALHEMRAESTDAQSLYRTAVNVDPTYQPAWSNLERVTAWEGRGRIDLGPEARESRPRGLPGEGGTDEG